MRRIKGKAAEKAERSKPEVVSKLRLIKIEDGYAYCEAKLVLAGNKEREPPAKKD